MGNLMIFIAGAMFGATVTIFVLALLKANSDE